jgi:hypothetical protein
MDQGHDGPQVSARLVALEVDEGAGGARLDAHALARELGSVGEIRPAGRGRRHSFLLRVPNGEPADALLAALARWREATVLTGEEAALMSVRLVQADQHVPATIGMGRPHLSPRLLATVAVVLLAGVGLFAFLGPRLRSPQGPSAFHHSGIAAAPGESGNLLSNPSFETPDGLAKGLVPWGAATFALVTAPVHRGRYAQRLQVAPGQMGGAWFELAATPSSTYRQSVWLDVTALGRDSTAEVVLEWYGPSANLLGYQSLPTHTTGDRLVLRSQTATSPPGTVKVRFLVNLSKGGTVVMDSADLRAVPAAPGHTGVPGPTSA